MSVRSIITYFSRECLDLAALLIPVKKNKGKKQVLLIRLDNIGDFILWLDSFQAYREIFPIKNYEITVIGNTAWKELGKNNLKAVSLFFINPQRFCSNLFYRWKILKQLRTKSYDIVIQPRYSRQHALEDTIVRLSSAQKKIGFASHSGSMRSWENQISSKWYNQLISGSHENIHELERNAEFIKGLKLSNFKKSRPRLHIPEKDKNTAIALISEKCPIKNYYILFVGSADPGKQWQPENFSTVGKCIYKHTGMLGIICGGHEDATIASKMMTDLDIPIKNLAGCTGLNLLAALIRKSRLVVSNDSVAVHMAAALSVPCVCILGGGQFGRFLPYPEIPQQNMKTPVAVYNKMPCFGCNWQCIHKRNSTPRPYICVSNVSAESVWKAIQKLIA